MRRDTSARVCIIGAGPSGITAAKNLLQVGLKNIVVYEKNEQVGGNWIYSPRLSHSSVFDTTHIISSKRMSQYHDFPMPADYPDYPSHQQVLKYFQDYARHFGVIDSIQFNTEVSHAEKLSDNRWQITLGDGTVEIFDYLIVCNGHHWDPRLPTYPGEYTGEFLHSHDYKTAAPFKDKRVLVIGGGNSACDISVETARVSAFTANSWRRGYYLIPKFMMGMPVDVLHARMLFLPRRIRELADRLAVWLNVGSYADYGLPTPKQGIYEVHPVTNSEMLYYIRHGKVHPRPDIKQFEGKKVHFVDNRVEEYDVIIAATGFYITFPFFDPEFISYRDTSVPLFVRTFHPEHHSLFFIGLVQPQGCIWPLSDAQSTLVANYIVGNYDLPANMPQRIQSEVAHRQRNYSNTPRHTIEVDFHDHIGELMREIPKNAPEWGELSPQFNKATAQV